MKKYTAWHKSKKEMYFVSKIDFMQEMVWCIKQTGDEIKNPFKLCDLEMLESTGRKDSLGIIIYVGDTVSFKAVQSSLPQGATELKSTGRIDWDDDDCCFFIANNCEYYPWVALWNAEDIVVTGTIFDAKGD